MNKRLIFTLFLVAICGASTLLGCRRPATEQPARPAVRKTRPRRTPGTTIKPGTTVTPNTSRYNMNAPLLPDPQMTPGDVLDVTPADFCVSGYSKKVRNVPSSVKKKVYAAYGIKSRVRGEYEVDHLISLQLGGSNSIRNLWPESYFTSEWNARKKDALENELHRRICKEGMDYKLAQQEIASDWIAAYKKYMKSAPKAMFHQTDPADTETLVASQAAPVTRSDEQVWVNLSSGKFFRSGDYYYGKTKSGKYMSESAALAAGHVEAGD